MIAKLKRLKNMKHTTSNRVVYAVLLLAVVIFAFTSGERMAYVSVVVLFVLPIISFSLTFVMLKWFNMKQTVPTTVLKGDEGVLLVSLNNRSPLPLTNMNCVFFCNEYALDVPEAPPSQKFTMNPFSTVLHKTPFRALYRGRYNIGVEVVSITDFMGLFSLTRKFDNQAELIVLPRIIELVSVPLAIDVVAEASSRFDIRDEDYSTIADIRSYLPTDSIKRVHWKLTAKRNEWLVKIFQSNALNCVSIILDNKRMRIPESEAYFLEDKMVEYSLGLIRYCLKKGMPVDFITTDGGKARAQTMSNFDAIYQSTARMMFEDSPALTPVSILTHVLNDSASYVNAVVVTATLDIALYERVINALNKGNYVAVIYFASEKPNQEYERIFKLLEEGGLPCFCITHEVMFDVA